MKTNVVEKRAKKKAKAHTRYRLDNDQLVPGLTTILGILNKPALVRWANNLGLEGVNVSDYVDELASIGTLAHAMITQLLEERIKQNAD